MSQVKFAVLTDLHHDAIPDGMERLTHCMRRAREADVDFIIELGDFCRPYEGNRDVLAMFHDFDKPCYHVIGNHDTDLYTKKEYMDWLGMDRSFYSFECGSIKFIVLDSAYVAPSVPTLELDWLQREITESMLPIVIFSHHSMENNFRERGVSNRQEVQNIINRATSSGKKVLICINGHDHAESIEKIDKTYYFGLNSMSYKWLGVEHFSYSDDIHGKYPYLKDMVLYREPLSAIISIDDQCNIDIEGMSGGYQKMSPEDLGIPGPWDGRTITSNVSSMRLAFM